MAAFILKKPAPRWAPCYNFRKSCSFSMICIKLQPILFTLYIKRMLYTKFSNCQSNMFASGEDILRHFPLISNVSHIARLALFAQQTGEGGGCCPLRPSPRPVRPCAKNPSKRIIRQSELTKRVSRHRKCHANIVAINTYEIKTNVQRMDISRAKIAVKRIISLKCV